MKVGIIGRSELIYNTVKEVHKRKHEIAFIISAKEAPEYSVTRQQFQDLASSLSVPFYSTTKIIEIYDHLKKHTDVDICLSANYSGIIPDSIIKLFRLGILNAHGGDLPKYRGNACQAWAIINGEEKIGLCIHKMIGDELDSGDIITRSHLQIRNNTKISEIWQWMTDSTPALFCQALELLEKNENYFLEKQSTDKDAILRCYPRRPEDGRIKWDNTAEDILKLINASGKPYSGAFCEFKSEKMIIWDAELADYENYLAIPGQVLKIDEEGVEIATGQGKLKIKLITFNSECRAPDHFIKSVRERLQ